MIMLERAGISVLLATAFLLRTGLPASAQAAQSAQTTASLDYTITAFEDGLHPWHLGALELNRRAAWGSLIGRATVARRYGQVGAQGEIESYPRIGDKVYLFLGAGGASSELFPDLRLGGEIFAVAARGLELSAGVRYLAFDARDITFFTASAALYPRGHYVALRPFVSSMNGDVQLSANLHVRRYLADESEWIGLRVGGGRVPNEQITAQELDRLSAIHAGLEGRHSVSAATGLRWSAGAEREKLPGDRSRSRFSGGIGVDLRF